jgi:hypothetical protein
MIASVAGEQSVLDARLKRCQADIDAVDRQLIEQDVEAKARLDQVSSNLSAIEKRIGCLQAERCACSVPRLIPNAGKLAWRGTADAAVCLQALPEHSWGMWLSVHEPVDNDSRGSLWALIASLHLGCNASAGVLCMYLPTLFFLPAAVPYRCWPHQATPAAFALRPISSLAEALVFFWTPPLNLGVKMTFGHA